jgi:hypothetical protein
MLPASFAMPTAVVLTVGGLVACFAGYRLFRIVLGIFGFIVGAMVTTSVIGAQSTIALVAAAIVGGLCGALLMVAAYFIGVGLVGAGLAALALNALWHTFSGDPPTVVLVVACVLGALAALSIQRYVIVFGTALGGAWTGLFGALALLGNSAAKHAMSTSGGWILYPLDPLPSFWWTVPAWLVLALVGAVVQLATTRRTETRPKKKIKN